MWRLLLLTALVACGSSAAPAPEGTRDDASTDGGASTDAPAGSDAPEDATFPPGDASLADVEANADADAAAAPTHLVAFASGYGPDIFAFSLDHTTGALGHATTTTAFGTAPSFLAVDRAATHLYAVDENATGRVGAYTIAGDGGALAFLDAVSSGGNGPPFVSVDATGRWVFVANYGDGTVSVLPVKPTGALGAPATTLTVGAEAHMIVADPSNRFVFVPCKGADYVAQFLFDASTGALTPNAVPHLATVAGAGPRHLAFHPNGRFVYLIDENSSTMTLLTLDATAGTLSEVQTVSTLPAGYSGPANTGAEVWVHPGGAWLFGSNRGDDSIAVFALDPATGRMTPKAFPKSGGTTPRDFTLDPTGTFLYAANQGTGNVVPFRFDASSGTLTPVSTPVSVTSASFVGVVALPGP